jgi:hypothetical protein
MTVCPTVLPERIFQNLHGYDGPKMPETLEHAKTRALGLLAANKPVEAICVMCHCLNGLGIPLSGIADRLQDLGPAEDVGDVRQWVVELEA